MGIISKILLHLGGNLQPELSEMPSLPKLGHCSSPNAPKTISLKTFSSEQLVSILQGWVGTQSFTKQALKLIAQEVATRSGDDRNALELAASSTIKCFVFLTERQDLSISKPTAGCPQYHITPLSHRYPRSPQHLPSSWKMAKRPNVAKHWMHKQTPLQLILE